MNEADVLARLPKITDKSTIPGLYQHRAAAHPGSVVVERRTPFGGWEDVTIEQLLAQVDVAARGLVGLGVEPGENVALLAATSYEWMVLDLAIMSAGAITVPIYESDSAKQIGHILADADVRVAITDTVQQAELLSSVAGPDVHAVMSIDTGAMNRLAHAAQDIDPAEVAVRRSRLRADDLATIIYTSGTTGVPKGVELTHRNFVTTSNAVHVREPGIAENPASRVLLFLPLAHVLARFVMHTVAAGPGRVAFSPNTTNLISDIAAFKPTALLVVPRVLEKVYNAARGRAGGGIKSRLFGWAAARARHHSERLEETGGKKSAQYQLADKLVLGKIRNLLGGNLEFLVCGGAPLATDLAHFYRGVGLSLVQGYGLSETTGPIAVQPPESNRPGSVGPLLEGNEIRIDSSDSPADSALGEILLRGNAVFSGYRNLPEENALAFDGDWFRTGDLGYVDAEGNVHITGRKKGLIVTAGGKNVSPEVLEDRLITHPLISQVVVVGEARPYIGALISLDSEMLPIWLANKGLPIVDAAAAAQLPEVQQSLQRAIDKANSNVSRAESIRKFRVVPTEFSVENGYLTPSMKLRRGKVLADSSDEVDALYSDEPSPVAARWVNSSRVRPRLGGHRL